MREQAKKQFEEQGLPTLRDEQWKYTSLRQLSKFLKESPTEPQTIESGCGKFISINAPESIAKPLNISEQNNLNQTLNLPDHPLAVLNTAQMHDGYEITVPDNTVVAEPIEIHCVATENQQLRHIIKIGKNSKAQIIFKYESKADEQYFTNVIQEIHLEANSQLEHVIIQNHNKEAFHIEGVHVKQADNSTMKSYALSKGAKLARFDIQTHYAAPGSHCEMIGLYEVSGKQHVDFHLNAEHKQPHCSTKQFYRGIVDDSGRAVFNARVAIHAQASKSVSEQTNNNLLLSDKAEVDTKPELEVYHDDVKAAHGATVGQLDKDALFYLQARGIEKSQAEFMLREAFLKAVLDEIDNPSIKALMEKHHGR